MEFVSQQTLQSIGGLLLIAAVILFFFGEYFPKVRNKTITAVTELGPTRVYVSTGIFVGGWIVLAIASKLS